MKKVLEMVFRDAMGDEVMITVSDPKDDLTLAQVRIVMQNIIDKNIFASKKGDLVQIADARVRVQETIALA